MICTILVLVYCLVSLLAIGILVSSSALLRKGRNRPGCRSGVLHRR